MKEVYLLGIDVGTTGVKAVLVRAGEGGKGGSGGAAGDVVAEAVSEYGMATPRALWAEQEPEDWWRATVESVRRVMEEAGAQSREEAPHPGPLPGGEGEKQDPLSFPLPPTSQSRRSGEGGIESHIAAVGLTGQMHGLVLLGARGQGLRPCIMWNDQRTGEECAEITKKVGAERVLQLTGNAVLPGFTAPKIAWVAKHEPAVFRKIGHVLLPKDYVRYRLTGVFGGDVSDASGTSLFDVGARKWSEEMCAAVGVKRAWLPAVHESTVASAKVSREGSAATGLREGTIVAAGAGDQAAQAIGTGIVGEGIVSVTIGTSGVVFAASERYRPEPGGRLHAFCHAATGMWHLMGVMLSAGGSFRWFRDTIGAARSEHACHLGKDPYDVLTEDAAKVRPGCEGLVFLPYLTGERTPYVDPAARGAFVGLTLRHTTAHLTRAVMEGVTFGLRDSLELMRGLGVRIEEVRASGGGARSAVWRQMLADVFETPIVRVNVTQGAAFGAAMLAGVAAGVWKDAAEASARCVRVIHETRPEASAVKVYRGVYPRYRAMYPALKGEFAALTRISGS